MTDIVADFELQPQPQIDAEFDLQEESQISASFTLTSGTIYHDFLLHRDYSNQHPISAITDLQDNLDTLQEHIDDEAETRENADEGLNEDIIAENERALEAEEALGERIDDIIDGTTNISYDNTVSGLEATTVKGALDELQSNVESETLRAETVEGDLDDLTTSEKTNLVGAINELDSSKQDNLTAGLGIDITNNEVRVTTPTLINSATGTNSLTVLGTSASQNGITNVGVSAEGIATNATSVGYSASADGAASTAVGKSANAHATRSIALGALSVASGDFSIAIGSHNSLHDSSARATAQSAIQLGNGTNSTANTFQVGSYTLLNTSTGIIPNARIDIDSVPTENSTNTVSSGGVYSKQGDLTTLTTTEKTDLVSAINELDSDKQENITAGTGIDITSNIVSVADPTLVNNGIGTKALAVGNTSQSTAEGGVSVGYGSRANSTYGTAVGYESRAGNTNTVAIGKGAEATQQRAIAIGSGAEANAQDAIAIKGINNTANTMQVYTYTLLDMATGLIPNARIDIDSTPTASSTNTVSSGGTYTMVNNVITGTTDIDYDNTTSGLSANTVKGAIDELASDVSDIDSLIPNQASSTNQLADKDFVNSSIATNTANFIGTFANVSALEAYAGTVTNNDYAFVVNSVVTDNGNDWADFATLDAYDKSLLTNFDYAWVVNGANFDLYRFDIVNQAWDLRESNVSKSSVTLNTAYNRYKATISGGTTTWAWEYMLNNSSFTASQWLSINSGATPTKINQIGTNANDISTINTTIGGYGDIVTHDVSEFATAAQGSLADTAVQPADLATVATSGSYTDLIDKPTIGNATLTIQKNGTDVDTFTANATSDKTINMLVPTDTSDLTNGAGYITGITSSDVTTALGYTPYDSSNPAGYTTNTGTVTSVNNVSPVSGNVTLSIPAAQIQSDWTQADNTKLDYIKNKPSLATVATSGSYNDLSNKPTIPAPQVNSDWNAVSGVAEILNKPTIPDISNLANKDLNNLTSTGQNIANWSSNVTNCITKIPQDIKLELSNGTITLKAGSKLYVPNGFNGTTRKFDVVTIDSDKTLSAMGSGTGKCFLYWNTIGNGWGYGNVGDAISGTTPPTNGVLYNTSTNEIRYYESGTMQNRQYSFPLAIVTRTSGTPTSIDKVFNGFGYIGSTVFALPGVKGLIPNGRNADGTYNTTKVSVNSVLTRDITGTGYKEFTLSSLISWETGGYFVDEDGYLYARANHSKANAVIFGSCDIITAGTFDRISFKKAFSMSDSSYIVDTYKSGTSWYRVYSDGWCVQGGYIPAQARNDDYPVTLLKPYIDTNYSLITNKQIVTTVTSNIAAFSFRTRNKTTSGFTTAVDPNVSCYWQACGYIS